MSYARAKVESEQVVSTSRLLLASAFTFDPCQGDIAAATYAGAELCLASREYVTTYLAACLRHLKVTHLCTTPALWNSSSVTLDDATHLQVLALGGEPMAKATIELWSNH
eukprot:707033-Ditylum_brightwellii.AAC.1